MPAWFRMPADEELNRALVVQLARLGDLVQSLPAITALRTRLQSAPVDLLCAAPLASIGSCIVGIDRVLPWEVERWRQWAARWSGTGQATLTEVETYLKMVMPMPYTTAFNLNQHSRATLAAHLFGEQVVGPGERGPLAIELPPWGDYLRGVARHREQNRVHLADMFCGLCGVMPTGMAPRLEIPATELPGDMATVGNGGGPWIAVVVGAGAPERCIPPLLWRDWIRAFLDASPAGQIVLVGSGADRERAGAIQDGLSSLALGRVWDATGRTTLVQTAALLARCQWVVGSDTGPLHLGTAVGARAMGLYFAHARVHETGPYGQAHWTWQVATGDPHSAFSTQHSALKADRWPLTESVELIVDGRPQGCDGWTLWQSHLDQWGAYYVEEGATKDGGEAREDVWRRVHRSIPLKAQSHECV